jgi:hypothetical protein
MNKKDKELELRILDLDSKEEELIKIEKNLKDKNNNGIIKKQKNMVSNTNNAKKCIKT